MDDKRDDEVQSAAALPGEDEKWLLRLYVAGSAPKCVVALRNLRKFCDEYITAQYELEVIDLLRSPALAKEDQIIAIPTLVRTRPEPRRKVVGDLSDTKRMLEGLDLEFKR